MDMVRQNGTGLAIKHLAINLEEGSGLGFVAVTALEGYVQNFRGYGLQ